LRALESFVLTHRNHTAREHTIVFPAWRARLSDGWRRYREH
jgi:hypothetical protein